MMETLSQRDRQVIWHPYTQMQTHEEAIAIVRGEGAYLYAEGGEKYIDAISSWWVNLHGHANPYIADKIHEQSMTLEQVIFAGFTHQPAVDLAERLLKLLPSRQKKVFYSDNGSTAVEVALKMCCQFWYNSGMPRTKILAFKNAYHGDTFGAMSVSGRSAWTVPFEPFLFDVHFIDVPNSENIRSLLDEIRAIHEQLACFIYEPLIQGAAGMHTYSAEHLDQLMEQCKKMEIICVQDEVFTGFGRTGKLFAAYHLKQQPDIMCFSKGLTGGTLALGVTSCSEDIYKAFLSKEAMKALFHGHSFTANPLACTAALASLDLLLEHQTQAKIEHISLLHQRFENEIISHPKVRYIRRIGTILAIECETGDDTNYFNQVKDKLYRFFLDKGILMRPLGNIIYLVPPYCIGSEDLRYVYKQIQFALDDVV